MDRRDATRLSKFLSLVLRHRPGEYGLQMDDQGFVDFEDLVDVVVAEDILAEEVEDEIMKLVEGSKRRRFAVEEGRIRALYGHSSGVRLNLPEHDPPASLYHGTTGSGAREIRANGLKPLGRAFVHLSSTEEEALAVGRRHADHPLIVRVDTAAAREHGIAFHQATDLIWLCPALPPEVCEVPDVPESDVPEGDQRREEQRPRRREEQRPRRRDEPADQPDANRPSDGGVRMVDAAEEGFKRRTRKKSRR